MTIQKTTKKKKTTKTPVVKKAVNSVDIYSQLNEWAHAGTQEALKALDEFIQNERNEDFRGHAECARDEAEFFYYSPQNEQEEKDFLLARSIWRRQERLWEREAKADAGRFELKKLDLDRQAHKKVIASLKDKNKKEDWRYNFSEDYYTIIKHHLEELEEEIVYERLWLKQARKMVKTKKYQVPPIHIFDHIHYDSDDFSVWEDEIE